MRADADAIREMLRNGLCCSQVIVAMGLRVRGEDNPSLVAASRGLCKGMHAGRICGCLTAAAQVFSLFDPANAAGHMIPGLFEWYGETYGERYGGESCLEITGGMPRPDICIDLVVATWSRTRGILEDFGFVEPAY